MVLANSIPKSGTNLLLRSLYMMPAIYRKLTMTINSFNEGRALEVLRRTKKGQIVAGHLKHSGNLSSALDRRNIKHILIIRDPRDIAVSNYIYITYKDKSHRLHEYFANALHDDGERLHASISGISANLLKKHIPSHPLSEHIRGYLPWFRNENVLLIKFEDLIGSKGGGRRQCQIDTLDKISRHIGIKLDSKTRCRIADSIFYPNSRTFVKGRIGTWKHHFNNEHKIEFKRLFGDILAVMGYEKDASW